MWFVSLPEIIMLGVSLCGVCHVLTSSMECEILVEHIWKSNILMQTYLCLTVGSAPSLHAVGDGCLLAVIVGTGRTTRHTLYYDAAGESSMWLVPICLPDDHKDLCEHCELFF